MNETLRSFDYQITPNNSTASDKNKITINQKLIMTSLIHLSDSERLEQQIEVKALIFKYTSKLRTCHLLEERFCRIVEICLGHNRVPMG